MTLDSGSDRRRLERVATSRRMNLFFEGKGRQQRAAMVDMSLLGVRIRTIGALIPGQHITMLPTEYAAHTFPCRVVWVSSSSSEVYSDAGLEFCAADKNLN